MKPKFFRLFVCMSHHLGVRRLDAALVGAGLTAHSKELSGLS
jgi:hypothetical protein